MIAPPPIDISHVLKRIASILVPLLALAPATVSQTALHLGFPEASYTARPGEAFDIVVQFDQSVPTGLAGYALKMEFPSQLFNISAITIVENLDYDLLTPGAQTGTTLTSAYAAGYVEAGTNPYDGTKLLTFSVLIPPNTPDGTYTIGLGALHPDAVNFVDGNGNPMDAQLTYGTASVLVQSGTLIENTRITREGGSLRLRFSGTPGHTYLIETSTTLSIDSWSTLTEAVAGSDGTVELTEPNLLPPSNKRFYRVNDQQGSAP